jgi:hypothetical protein
MKGMISPNEESLPVVSVPEELFSSSLGKNHSWRAALSEKGEPEGAKTAKAEQGSLEKSALLSFVLTERA